VSTEFAAEGREFAAAAILEDGIGNPEGAAKASDNAAYGGDFDLRGGVADQEDFAIADAPADGYPLLIDRDTGALPLEGLHVFLFEEALDAAFGVAAIFADDAERSAFGGFGNEPVEVGRVVGDEPDAGGVRGTVFGQADDGLHEGHRFDGRPAGGASDTAGGAIGADEVVGVDLVLAARGVNLNFEAMAVGGEAEEASIEIESRASLLGGASQGGDQARAFNDEVRFIQRDLRGAAIREEFKTANLVHDALGCSGAKLLAEMIGDNERAGGGLEMGLGFEDANPAATLCDFRRGE